MGAHSDPGPYILRSNKMKLLVIFVCILFTDARKFKTAMEVREHMEKVEYEELTRAAEATAKDLMVLGNELKKVAKANDRALDFGACITCGMELVPKVMTVLPMGVSGILTTLDASCIVKKCLCGLMPAIPGAGLVIQKVMKILGICLV